MYDTKTQQGFKIRWRLNELRLRARVRLPLCLPVWCTFTFLISTDISITSLRALSCKPCWATWLSSFGIMFLIKVMVLVWISLWFSYKPEPGGHNTHLAKWWQWSDFRLRQCCAETNDTDIEYFLVQGIIQVCGLPLYTPLMFFT